MSKVIFKTGRGGRFYNAGHLSFVDIIERGFNAEDYGIPVFFSFENWWSVSEDISSEDLNRIEEHFNSISDLAYQFETLKSEFNELKIVNQRESDDENTVYITADDLGEPIVTDDVQDELCTLAEYIGEDSFTLDIDGDYNSYHVMNINDLSDEQLDVLARESGWKSKEFLKELYRENEEWSEIRDLIENECTCKDILYNADSLDGTETLEYLKSLIEE